MDILSCFKPIWFWQLLTGRTQKLYQATRWKYEMVRWRWRGRRDVGESIMRHAPSHPWRAWRGESSHIKVLSRKRKKKKKLASTCPTIPACREVDSDRAYFLPGKQHYFHFLLHCRLSSRCAVSISKQSSEPLCTCPSMSAYLHRRTEN